MSLLRDAEFHCLNPVGQIMVDGIGAMPEKTQKEIPSFKLTFKSGTVAKKPTRHKKN
jgi:hypothetical protein